MCVSLGSSEHPSFQYVEQLNIACCSHLKKVLGGPVIFFINDGPMFDIPLTFKDEHVNKLFLLFHSHLKIKNMLFYYIMF